MASHHCSAINCSNRRINCPGLSFFTFPRDAERSKVWVVRSRREDLLKKDADYLSKNCRLCAEHFESSQFMNATERNKLIWNTLPSIFDVPNPPAPIQSKRRRLERTVQEKPKPKTCTWGMFRAQPQHQDDHSYVGQFTSANCDETSQRVGSAGDSQPTQVLMSSTSKRRQDTPRKTKLKLQLKSSRVKCSRLLKRLTRTPSQNVQHRKFAALNELRPYLTAPAFTLLAAQVRLHGVKRARNWTKNERLVALAIHYQSPKVYRFLTKLFILPAVASLHRWIQPVKIEPGLNNSMTNLLKLKVKNLSERDRNCLVMMDEMAIKKGLRYCKMRDVVVGYEDNGKDRTSTMSNSAFVFMVRGLFSRWKQAICFYLTSNKLQSDDVKGYLFDVLQELSSLGLFVRIIVSDQGSTFSKMFTGLGVSPAKPWLEFEGSVICVMPDPPHLLKNVRNALFRYNIEHDGGTAKWNHITSFVYADIERKLRLAPRLTKKHVELPPFSQMKVKLASQLLSHSTAAGLETYIAEGSLPAEAAFTATLCENFNDLFDCFNSSNFHGTVHLRTALSDNSDHFARLTALETWLKSLKVIDPASGKDVTSRFRCFNGWLQAIAALRKLWTTVKVMSGVKFLFTRKINQDQLEHFFSIIRQRGGLRDNPTALEFMFAFKQACINGLLLPAHSGNCDVDDLAAVLLSGVQVKPAGRAVVSNSTVSVDVLHKPIHCPDDWVDKSVAILEENSLVYFTGYILKRLFACHRCLTCSSTCDDNACLDSTSKLFTSFKAYESKKDDSRIFHGLLLPVSSFSEFMNACEGTVSFHMQNELHRSHVKASLVSVLQNSVNIAASGLCPIGVEFVLDLFVRCRIYFRLKYLSQKATDSKPRKNRKAKKVMNV